MEPIGKNVYHYQLHQNDPPLAAIENKGREFSKKGLRNIGPRGVQGVKGVPRISEGFQVFPRVSKGFQGFPKGPRFTRGTRVTKGTRGTGHSMLRLDATTKKGTMENSSNSKNLA